MILHEFATDEIYLQIYKICYNIVIVILIRFKTLSLKMVGLFILIYLIECRTFKYVLLLLFQSNIGRITKYK